MKNLSSNQNLSIFILILSLNSLFLLTNQLEIKNIKNTKNNIINSSNNVLNNDIVTPQRTTSSIKSTSETSTEAALPEVASYNKLPEYMANYFGQGHKLDCLNICKKCIKDSIVSEVYYDIKEKTNSDFVIKEKIDEELNKKLSTLKTENAEKYKELVSEKTEFTEAELNPKNLFRIYFDQCIIFNNAFYS